jgi:hypothetical protein
MSSKDRVEAVLLCISYFAISLFGRMLSVLPALWALCPFFHLLHLHLFEENCSTTVEKSHLALEPALSAETCHLDARKKSYYAGLE